MLKIVKLHKIRICFFICIVYYGSFYYSPFLNHRSYFLRFKFFFLLNICSPLLSCIFIPIKGCFTVKAPMRTPVVEIIKKLFKSIRKYFSVLCMVQVNILLFYGSPKSFYQNIVQTSSFSIHTDNNLLFFKIFNPAFTPKLRALIRVHQFWLTKVGNCFIEHFQAISGFQCVGYTPTHYKPAIHIYNGR